MQVIARMLSLPIPLMGDEPPPHGMIALPLSAILLLILSLYSLPESSDDEVVILFLFPFSPSLPLLRRFSGENPLMTL